MSKKEININLNLFTEIRSLIEQSRQNVAVTVNSEITMLYWHIGKRINKNILKNKRAEYGKQILKTLSKKLTQEYGRGWSEKHLRHCLRIAEIIQIAKLKMRDTVSQIYTGNKDE